MLSTSVLHTLAALQVFALLSGEALPITTKPIEGTAQDLAWQDWMQLTEEQKNQQKPRRITQKSIFTLPFRQCPPGHHLFQDRCIATVQINENDLLQEQLSGLGLFDGLPNPTDTGFEIDYGDETEMVMYDQPQLDPMGTAATIGSNYDDASQLPSRDEPLRFNLFQQKFPVADYAEMGSGASASVDNIMLTDSQEGSGAAATNATSSTQNLLQSTSTQFLHALQNFLARQTVENQTNATNVGNQINSSSSSNNLYDLQADASSINSNAYVLQNMLYTPTKKGEKPFVFGDIDAIALPATAATTTVAGNRNLEPQQEHNKVSLFKDDSVVQLITQTVSQKPFAQQSNISQLLKADALLPLQQQHAATTNRNTADLETVTVTGQDEVPTAIITTTTKTERVLPTAAQQLEIVKDERTRSVTMLTPTDNDNQLHAADADADADVYADLNEEFDEGTTTLMPVETTNFQLDETTVIEALDPQAIELRELQERLRENHAVLKKSKVEPVDISTAATENNSEAETETATPLPSVATETTIVAADRFSSNVAALTGSASSNGNSEINIEQELRMINDLVKGKQQPVTTAATKATTTTTTTAAAAATAFTTESSTATTMYVADRTTTTTTATAIDEQSLAKTIANLRKIANIVVDESYSSDSTTTTATTATRAASATDSSSTEATTSRNSVDSNIDSNSSSSGSSIESSSSSSSTPISSIINSSNNRSNRNSKIIRISNLSANSLNANSAAAADTTATATVTEPSMLKQSSTAEPFWWLPRGWRLDGNARQDNNNNDERPLLLRFWSAFPSTNQLGKRT